MKHRFNLLNIPRAVNSEVLTKTKLKLLSYYKYYNFLVLYMLGWYVTVAKQDWQLLDDR